MDAKYQSLFGLFIQDKPATHPIFFIQQNIQFFCSNSDGIHIMSFRNSTLAKKTNKKKAEKF